MVLLVFCHNTGRCMGHCILRHVNEWGLQNATGRVLLSVICICRGF